MKQVSILLALLLASVVARAEFTGLPENVRTNLAAIQKYPTASSILLDCRESYTLNDDGSQVYEWHSFRYFPDEAARDAFGDPRINYAEGRQTVSVLRARTYTLDGRQIDCTPENAYNPVVADEMDLAPEFGEYRQLVVTLLGLENGSISEMHYRITTPKPLIPWLEGRVYLREEVPVISRAMVVQCPAGVALNYKGDHGAPEPNVTGSQYVWTLGEQSGYLAEDLSGHRELLPSVEFTTAKSWSDVCIWLSGRLTVASADPITIPESLRDAVSGIGTVNGQVDAIKTWVGERFRKVHFEHPEFKHTLRTAQQIMNSGYGTGFELALLVQSLAADWKIKSELYPRFENPVVPSLCDWTDPVLNVHPDFGGEYLTDALAPTSEIAIAFASTTILDLATCEPREQTHKSNATPHVSLWLTLADLKMDTVEGHGAMISTGNWGIAELVQENGAEEYLNQWVTLPGFVCTSAKVRELSPHRVALDFDFTISALDTADNFRVLPLSALDFSSVMGGAPWGLPTREFAQAVPHEGEIAIHLEAPLPDEWELTRKPSNSSETWDWSSGEISCKLDDGRLVYDRKLKLAREWVAPSGWKGLRSWIIESGPRPNHNAVFRTK